MAPASDDIVRRQLSELENPQLTMKLAGVAGQILAKHCECSVLVKLLEHPRRTARFAACEALRLGNFEFDEVAVKSLLAAIDDDTRVAVSAIKALGKKRVTSAESEIASCLGMRDADIVAAALEALAQLGASKIASHVLEHLSSPNPAIVKAAAQAVIVLQLIDAAPVLLATLQSRVTVAKRNDTRPGGWNWALLHVVEALGRLGHTESIPLLTELATRQYGLRTRAFEALARMGVEIGELFDHVYEDEPSKELVRMRQRPSASISNDETSVVRKRPPISGGVVDRLANKRLLQQCGDSFIPGLVTRGTIVLVANRYAIVETNGIAGLIPKEELDWGRAIDPRQYLVVGQTVDVFVVSVDAASGEIVYSIRRLHPDPWENIENILASQQIVRCTVESVAAIGVFVRVEPRQVVGLIHVSQIPLTPGQTAKDHFLPGQEITARVLELDRPRRRLSLTLKVDRLANNKLLLQQREHSFIPGLVTRGTITFVASGYAFVETNGITGLIPKEELDWERGLDPQQHLVVGQTVDVFVVSVDAASGKIVCSIRRLHPDPWENIENILASQHIVRCTVESVVAFGVFVRVEPRQVVGLIHVSQIPLTPGQTVKDHFLPGQEVSARVLELDQPRRRLSLTLNLDASGS